ncbi:DnaJ-like protein [Striga asiatica]|uniref:DnaJ-like protein n=1 Tax=Striga asiatica TaxID=4170 RepID=A0A5A7RIF6_STRAF|nr:DnaJ-like protein [Striga asiatica]
MASSTSFAFSTARSFPTASPNHRPQLRISAAAAGVTGHAAPPQAEASFYEVLGIRTGATCQEIKSAYRSLARVLHPDAAAGGGARPSADEFMRVHAAYATLSDPKKREAYDRSLLRWPRAVAISSAGGFCVASGGRRTWETDQCW